MEITYWRLLHYLQAKFEFFHEDYKKQLMKLMANKDKAGLIINNPCQSVFLFVDRQHMEVSNWCHWLLHWDTPSVNKWSCWLSENCLVISNQGMVTISPETHTQQGSWVISIGKSWDFMKRFSRIKFSQKVFMIKENELHFVKLDKICYWWHLFWFHLLFLAMEISPWKQQVWLNFQWNNSLIFSSLDLNKL